MAEENKQTEADPIKRAEDAAARLEAANKRSEELLTRQALSGQAAAGSKQEPVKEESAREYAARILKGRK